MNARLRSRRNAQAAAPAPAYGIVFPLIVPDAETEPAASEPSRARPTQRLMQVHSKARPAVQSKSRPERNRSRTPIPRSRTPASRDTLAASYPLHVHPVAVPKNIMQQRPRPPPPHEHFPDFLRPGQSEIGTMGDISGNSLNTFQVDPFICGHGGHADTSCGLRFSTCFDKFFEEGDCNGKGEEDKSYDF